MMNKEYEFEIDTRDTRLIGVGAATALSLMNGIVPHGRPQPYKKKSKDKKTKKRRAKNKAARRARRKNK